MSLIRDISKELKNLSVKDWLFLVFVSFPMFSIAMPFGACGLIYAFIVRQHNKLLQKMPKRNEKI